MPDQPPNYFVWVVVIAGAASVGLAFVFAVLKAKGKVGWPWWRVFLSVLTIAH